MFREMRRNKQLLSPEKTEEIFRRASSGVLAVSGDDGYPYAVPVSFVYADGKIYIHCAKTGHKLDGILRSSKVSFCVIDRDEIVPSAYTTYFRSAIAFGQARIMTEEAEIREAVHLLAVKYSPLETEESRQKEIDGAFNRLCMVEISVEHMTGKEAIELVNQ